MDSEMGEATKKARQRLITSSNAGAALGLDPVASPIDAWLAIMGRTEFAGNKATNRGNRLENETLRYGAEVIGAKGFYKPSFVRHPTLPWAGDSCDAIYLDDWGDPLALGEAKTIALGGAGKWGAEHTGDVPPKVDVQARWHLLHYKDAPYCLVPVLIGGYEFEFRTYRVDRDSERDGVLIEALARWHRDYVVADKMPPVTALDTEFVVRMYPQQTDDFLEPTPEIDALALECLRLTELRIQAEKDEAEARNQLRTRIDGYAGVRGEGYSITYRHNSPTCVTPWEKIALAAGATPELIESMKYQKPGNRPLIIKRPSVGKKRKLET